MHNLNFKDGKASMFFIGEKPWHSFGTQLQNVATSAEAIVAAQLDYVVEKRQVLYQSTPQHGNPAEFKGKFVTVRADNEKALGIVGNIYRPLQNKEAFSFFDAVVGEKAAMYHTAGALGDGEKVWILAKLPGTIKVTDSDVVEKFLLLSNSHDGSSAVEMMFSPIRVVCQNTLNMALSSATHRFTARHTMSVGQKVSDARDTLGIIYSQYDVFEELSKKMLNVHVNQKQYTEYLEKIGVIAKDEDGTYSTRTQNTLNNLVNLYEHGKGNDMPKVAGTIWAAMNAVVEYVDYVRGSDGNRTKSILYGSGAVVKQKAWDLAVAQI